MRTCSFGPGSYPRTHLGFGTLVRFSANIKYKAWIVSSILKKIAHFFKIHVHKIILTHFHVLVLIVVAYPVHIGPLHHPHLYCTTGQLIEPCTMYQSPKPARLSVLCVYPAFTAMTQQMITQTVMAWSRSNFSVLLESICNMMFRNVTV